MYNDIRGETMETKDILKSLRERYSLSIRKLSTYINIGFSGLSKIERGEISLTMKTINSLTRFYSVTSDYILGKDPNGFIIQYEYENEDYYEFVSEATLDEYIGKKYIEEFIGTTCIKRTVISNDLITEFQNGTPPTDKKNTKSIYFFKFGEPAIQTKPLMNFEIMKAYTSLSDTQRKLVDDLILSLAGGNTRNG